MSIQVYAKQKHGFRFTEIKISYVVEGVLNTLFLEKDDAQHLFEVLVGKQDVMFINKNDDTPRYSYTEVVYASKGLAKENVFAVQLGSQQKNVFKNTLNIEKSPL